LKALKDGGISYQKKSIVQPIVHSRFLELNSPEHFLLLLGLWKRGYG